MRTYNNGAYYTVQFGQADCNRWLGEGKWPGSEVQGSGSFTFDTKTGDLVETGGEAAKEHGNGSGWLEFSHWCQTYGARRMGLTDSTHVREPDAFPDVKAFRNLKRKRAEKQPTLPPDDGEGYYHCDDCDKIGLVSSLGIDKDNGRTLHEIHHLASRVEGCDDAPVGECSCGSLAWRWKPPVEVPPIRTLEDLDRAVSLVPREKLEMVARFAFGMLYLDVDTDQVDFHKDVSGADFIEHMTDALGRAGIHAEEPATSTT